MASKRDYMHGTLCIVTWYDAWGVSSWTSYDDIANMSAEKTVVTTVGWVIDNNKLGMTLAASTCPDPEAALLAQFIPKGCIMNVTFIQKYPLDKIREYEKTIQQRK